MRVHDFGFSAVQLQCKVTLLLLWFKKMPDAVLVNPQNSTRLGGKNGVCVGRNGLDSSEHEA